MRLGAFCFLPYEYYIIYLCVCSCYNGAERYGKIDNIYKVLSNYD